MRTLEGPLGEDRGTKRADGPLERDSGENWGVAPYNRKRPIRIGFKFFHGIIQLGALADSI